MTTICAFPAEFRFVDSDEPGTLNGYGSVYNRLDWHGDLLLPGAFDESLAEHRAAGTMPAMFIEHSGWKGGDPLPIGKWTDIYPDDKGLVVKGKLSALNTDHGKRVHELVKDGVIRGLSIAFNVPPGGAVMGRKAGEAKRTISKVQLLGVDLVRDPSQSAAQINEIRSMVSMGDHEAAASHIAAAMQMHKDTLSGHNSPSSDQRAMLMKHLQDAHKALTGDAMPAGMKATPTLRILEDWLKREFDLSNSQATYIAEHGLKSLPPRDGVDPREAEKAAVELKAAEEKAAAEAAEKAAAEAKAAEEEATNLAATEQKAREEARAELAGVLSGFTLNP